MSFVPGLRDELVAAAEREQTRRLPRFVLPSQRTLLAAAAAAALALIVALAAASLSTAPRESVPADPEPTPDARPLFGGTLTPDVPYTTRAFVPALSFTVADDEWYAGETELPDALVLERRPRLEPGEFQRPVGGLAFDRITEVHDPRVRGADASRVAAPGDLLDWLRRHPDLRVSRPEPTTIANVPGETVDVEVDFTRPAHGDPFCRQRYLRRCTLLAPGLSFFDGTRLRVTVLATEPQPLVVTVIGINQRALATVEKAAAPVLDSLRIGVR
jgi:hypothetical protein